MLLTPATTFVHAAEDHAWPTFRHDSAHTGFSPSAGPETNKTIWTHSVGGVSSPVVYGGKVFIASTVRGIFAFEASSGELVWNIPTGGIIVASLAAAEGLLYVATYNNWGLGMRLFQNNQVLAYDIETGRNEWNFTVGADVFSSPVVDEGRLYIGAFDGQVYALDARTGRLIWAFQTDDMVWSSPAVWEGLVFVGSDDGKVYALKADNGALAWKYDMGFLVRSSSPAISDGILYIGGFDENIYALDATTGTLIWTFASEAPVLASPAVADGKVFTGSSDSNLYALNKETGDLVWKFNTGGPVWSSAAVANDLLYFGSVDGNIYALRAADGSLVWKYGAETIVDSSPAVAEGRVFMASRSALYAFEVEDSPFPFLGVVLGAIGVGVALVAATILRKRIAKGSAALGGGQGKQPPSPSDPSPSL